MASGSSGRANSGSNGFDFGSDDILCSYDDFANQEPSKGSHSDPANSAANLTQDFHKNRVSRTAAFPSGAYGPPENSFNQELASAMDRTMKKYTDNVLRFLEGISSRLSQLELYCYNLDKSIGEMRSDLTRDNSDADAKLKSLEKHVQEVHRSVQILRDKQELAETQKELAKIQIVQKDTSASSNEERASTPDKKRSDNTSDNNDKQLALALPQQIVPQQQPPPQNQQQSYYLPPSQFPNPSLGPAPVPVPQQPLGQYMSSDPQYRPAQLQEFSRLPPQPLQPQMNQPQAQVFPQYQQQWPQQPLPLRPTSPAAYPPYPPSEQTNQSPSEMPYSGAPQSQSGRVEPLAYYGTPGRTAPQQPPPQQMKTSYGTQPGDGYNVPGSQPGGYVVYENEGGRAQYQPQQPNYPPQGGYRPVQNQQPPPNTNLASRNPGHPYGDLIEKLVSMGFRGDHAASVIQRMEESGQQVDFNSVLDRMNVQASGGPRRGW